MDKKGLAWATLVAIIIILVSFVIIFGWQYFFGEFIKEESGSSTCKLSVLKASNEIGILEKDDLPKLNCPKISVEIKGEKEEEIKSELLDLFVKASSDFGVSRETYSKITGKYCRRRYHPITFKKKGLVVKNFLSYLSKNKPKNFVGELAYSPSEINTNNEYSILFVVVYKEDWWKSLKNLGWRTITLGGFEYKFKSGDLGFAIVKSDEVLGLGCEHLV